MNPGMPQDPSQYFNNFNMGPQSISFSHVWSQYQYPPWKQWVPQTSLNPSWNQNWRGPFPTGQFPQSMPQQQLQLPSNVPPGNPALQPQLPIQPNPNPNNKGVQQTDTLNLPSYSISTAGLNEINLRSGWVVNAPTSPIIIKQIENEVTKPEPKIVGDKPDQNIINQTPPQPALNQGHPITPPYLQRFTLSKQSPQEEFHFLGELQNIFVKICLLQAMRDVPIYAKTLREYCSKKPGKKSGDLLTIHVMGRLSDIILEKPCL